MGHEYVGTVEQVGDVAIPCVFVDAHSDIRNHQAVIFVDGDGNHTEVRYHSALLGPVDLDPESIEPLYAAWQAFGRILRDPDLEFVFKMAPGHCQVFDNRRVLHACAEFDPNTGPRHLQGTYVDRDDFISRPRVLARKGRDFRYDGNGSLQQSRELSERRWVASER